MIEKKIENMEKMITNIVRTNFAMKKNINKILTILMHEKNNNIESEEEKEEKEETDEGKEVQFFTIPLISSNPNPKQTPKITMNSGATNNGGFDPMKMLFNLAFQKPQKQEVEEISDDDYDENISAYDTINVNIDKNFVELNKQLTNINDLIKLGEQFEEEVNNNKENKKENKDEEMYELNGKKYSVNLNTIVKLMKPLKRLKKMIGLNDVKEKIFDMIVYYLQGFEKNTKSMLHSVIEGPPGVGKTRLGKILASIYSSLGVIPSEKFKYVKATDLIGEHVGATRQMTQSVIDEADGGVLFIDEAYALGSSESKDPYGKECIDTLNFNLSENKKKIIIIIAGYADMLEKNFFSYNQGLQRRFPFRFRINGYSDIELKDIFIDKIKKSNWKILPEITNEKIINFFRENKQDFQNFGGDIDNFLKSCQYAHSKRMLGKHINFRKKISYDDLINGFHTYKDNKTNNDCEKQYMLSMYT